MKKIAVLTSGGDAPGMNAAIRAVVRFGIYHDLEVFGVHKGFAGLIDNDFERMYRRSVADILHRGGTVLRTARSKRFREPEFRKVAYENMKNLGIEGLVVIGGNGSLSGAKLLADEFKDLKVIGLPGTIDNDLGYTDFTIGFDTAVNTVLEGISKIRDTSSSHDRSTVIEVMGRNSGDIALYAGLTGGAELVLQPESELSIDDMCKALNDGINVGKLHNIIIKAEGYPLNSYELIKILKEKTGQDIKLAVLSYLQRGGAPTFRDRQLATECGMRAVELLKNDIGYRAIGTVGGKVIHVDLAKALEAKSTLREDLVEAIRVLSM
jgi:6-phosphofructokinase 1